MDLGVACHVCGHLNPLRSASCARCGALFTPAATPPAPTSARNTHGGLTSPPPLVGPAWPTAPHNPSATAPGTGVPSRGMTPTSGSYGAMATSSSGGGPAKTMFFGALQQQVSAPRLVVIKGEGSDGTTYHLQGVATTLGRSQGDISFPDDPFLSPAHARFTSQDGRLFVQDLESVNGVFVRIRQPTVLRDGDHLLVGEELLRVDYHPFADPGPSHDGTYFHASPRPKAPFRVTQVLAGGPDGRIALPEGLVLTIGREGNTLDFPHGRFISGAHARLDLRPDTGEVFVSDTGSRNGTFVRISGARELLHGDYVFVGQQLLRVEIG